MSRDEILAVEIMTEINERLAGRLDRASCVDRHDEVAAQQVAIRALSMILGGDCPDDLGRAYDRRAGEVLSRLQRVRKASEARAVA